MLTVFYDSWCPLCNGVTEQTRRLDRRQRVVFISFRDENVVKSYQLSEDMLRKMEQRLFVYDGEWQEGIYAVKRLAKEVPTYWLLIPFIQLAITFGFGQRVYDYIASRRSIVPTGHCQEGVCPIGKAKH
ncbi:DUF393 domain-containing protein [Ectobacillus antri]|jgi:predicted DCC family thiol-disulfide oxidoreductase YuxK|uniref:DUF393 domain-containing protein n=1 Tax=Ectobacillus antri TaxID=2486280 RepID=A0ABT6H2F7_9BACI|nr:DUF393 domain-containing protein [Ectobacillus antri]MDG4656298.1 DUF393 domain-containing protein [Ectobacillus antri]MDG5752973.1 DUF393 domain-containing protein [Ectobacillus antri]